jgi:predicted dehydrogenase
MAVVGVGHFGRFHAEKIRQLPRAKLVAVADIDKGRAAEASLAFDVEAVGDYRDLIGRVDPVSVAVPTFAHYQVAKDFLENGVDVLVEKPITNDLKSAGHLVALAERKKLILQVGHLARFTDMVEVLRSCIDRPRYIDSVRIAPFQARGTDVNVILDLMIHDLDLVLSLVGVPIESVDAAGAPVFSESEDIANARLRFANGCIAHISASRISLKTERVMRIFQPEAYIRVGFDQQTIKIIRKGKGHMRPGIPNIETTDRHYTEVDALKQEVDAFLTSVIQRRRPLVSGQDGLEALRAAIMVTESLRAHAAFVDSVEAGRPMVQDAT